MKLEDYKGRKVIEPEFWKKFLIWRYSQKGLQISPKSDTLIYDLPFLGNTPYILVFDEPPRPPKLDFLVNTHDIKIFHS